MSFEKPSAAVAFSSPPPSYSSLEKQENAEKIQEDLEDFEQNFTDHTDAAELDKKALKWILSAAGMLIFGVLFINAAIWSVILGRGPTEILVNDRRTTVDESEILAPALISLACFFGLSFIESVVAFFMLDKISQPEGCPAFYAFSVALAAIPVSIYYFALRLGAENWHFIGLIGFGCCMLGALSFFLTFKYASTKNDEETSIISNKTF